jgi:hypothetical protein
MGLFPLPARLPNSLSPNAQLLHLRDINNAPTIKNPRWRLEAVPLHTPSQIVRRLSNRQPICVRIQNMSLGMPAREHTDLEGSKCPACARSSVSRTVWGWPLWFCRVEVVGRKGNGGERGGRIRRAQVSGMAVGRGEEICGLCWF